MTASMRMHFLLQMMRMTLCSSLLGHIRVMLQLGSRPQPCYANTHFVHFPFFYSAYGHYKPLRPFLFQLWSLFLLTLCIVVMCLC